MPVYLGWQMPNESIVQERKNSVKSVFAYLDQFILRLPFLATGIASAADILFACEISALEIDKDFPDFLALYPNIAVWYQNLKQINGYQESHYAWNRVSPKIKQRLEKIREGNLPTAEQCGDPSWVADMCEATLIS